MKKILAISLLSGAVLTGCGGSDSTTDVPSPTVPDAKANLDVIISGLPQGMSGEVSITGPDGYSETLTSSQTLSDLSPGSYTLSVANIAVDGVTFDVLPETQTVSLSANDSDQIALVYQAPVTSTGSISNFGSVYVNGIRFKTNDAVIETDLDQGSTEDDLKVGMVVTIQGRSSADGDDAQALSVEYHVNAQGPVDAVSLTDSSFSLLGQVFLVDELTLFEGVTFDALAVGDVVEVSAIETEAGELVASRVELEDSSVTELKVRGELQNLDEVAQTFTVNQLTVDYSAATVNGTLVEGEEVRIHASAAPVDDVLVADSVYVQEDDDADDAGQVALDGVITELLENMQFMVAGQTVAWSQDTAFFGGDEQDIVVGMRIKAFGTVVDDVLTARKIRIDKPGVIKLEGPISAVDSDASTLTVLGTVFTVDSHSRLMDKSSQGVRRMTLDDLAIGDVVDVKAFQDGDALVTRQLKRTEAAGEDDDGLIELEGQVTEIAAPNFQVQGVTVETSALTEFELDDAEVDADTFFATIVSGDVIEVKGQLQESGNVLALEVERGSDDDEVAAQVKLKGQVASVTSETEFVLNGRSVFINDSTRFEDGSIDDLVADAYVEVKGLEDQDGSIVASKIEFEREDDNEEVEVKGVIETFVSVTEFTVNGVSVTTNDSTAYKDGAVSDLAQGVSVEVEGYVSEAGVLLAEKIDFENEAEEMELTGVINGFESAQAFFVGDQAVTTTGQTKYRNGNQLRLANEEQVTVEGYLEGDVLIAKKIEFSEREEVELEGEITQVTSDSQFVVDGTVVFIDELTVFKKGGLEDIAVGVGVEVKGYPKDGGVLAEVVKLEKQDKDDD
ncbi:DUF5666 domain-containing protein [Aestuariibacter halophilus]|uniref:DUF5666 domain-containing protein n=1 Tax=Fluctibacter halophilus TaxID=226011 RepID=A0ABS8G9P8_9ALTE|nr:DUF5666 domain-containing protein [Aestuariibacter halophilus]MCC2617290.1 DUF5666 domain-containing protein [Aestuariibacter halophilus]